MLYAIKPVVIAIITFAVADLGRTATKTRFLAALGAAAAIANVFGMPELAVLFGAGFVSVLWRRGIHINSAVSRTVVPLDMFLYFLKIGSVLFGSGYVLVAFLQADLVEKAGVLTQRQLIDAIAVGQITPGPLFTTATFIGYLLAGTQGAILGTIGIFLPAFVFVAITHSFVRRLRKNPAAQAILDGINVAAVAIMAVVVWRLAHAAFVDGFSLMIGIIAAAILWRFRAASAWVVLGAAMIGLISDFVG
jgi:chromate transporter